MAEQKSQFIAASLTSTQLFDPVISHPYTNHILPNAIDAGLSEPHGYSSA